MIPLASILPLSGRLYFERSSGGLLSTEMQIEISDTLAVLYPEVVRHIYLFGINASPIAWSLPVSLPSI
jgi:hypothetical protein